MHPLRCPYLGNASALRASRGVHNKGIIRLILTLLVHWNVGKYSDLMLSKISNFIKAGMLKYGIYIQTF